MASWSTFRFGEGFSSTPSTITIRVWVVDLVRIGPTRRHGPGLSGHPPFAHNGRMGRPGLQFSVAWMLGLVACVAVNIWLFRVGFLYGLVGLNVTKHVGVAALCQAAGVNRRTAGGSPGSDIPEPHGSLNGSP